MSGDAMNALPAAKSSKIASGGTSEVPYCSHLPRKRNVTVSGGPSSRIENAHLPQKCRESMSGDAMNALPAAKSSKIASGGTSEVPYCSLLPRKRDVTVSGGPSSRIENAHLTRKCRESMSGDAMNALPAAKSAKIASGETSEVPYCSHLPRKRDVTVSGVPSSRIENAHLPRKCREFMSGDAMNALPAAKSAKIASGETSEVPYCSHLPRKRNVTVSGGPSARTENAHLPRKCRESMPGDAMNALPAAKSAKIASGETSEVPYCSHLPRKRNVAVSGGPSARTENAYLPRKCRESMPGDAMNVLPAAKSSKIASGGTSEVPYCSHLPRKRNVTVSGGSSSRIENAHLRW